MGLNFGVIMSTNFTKKIVKKAIELELTPKEELILQFTYQVGNITYEHVDAFVIRNGQVEVYTVKPALRKKNKEIIAEALALES